VIAALQARGWALSDIVLTHHHADHIDGVEELKATLNPKARVVGAAADAHRLPPLDLALAEGDTFEIGTARAHVIDVPGHTVGHVAYHVPAAQAAFTGDSLMAMGCGRLFEGTPAQMWDSLQQRGFWNGEIWNRRKDGNVFPEGLSIVAIGVLWSFVYHPTIGILTNVHLLHHFSQLVTAGGSLAHLFDGIILRIRVFIPNQIQKLGSDVLFLFLGFNLGLNHGLSHGLLGVILGISQDCLQAVLNRLTLDLELGGGHFGFQNIPLGLADHTGFLGLLIEGVGMLGSLWLLGLHLGYLGYLRGFLATPLGQLTKVDTTKALTRLGHELTGVTLGRFPLAHIGSRLFLDLTLLLGPIGHLNRRRGWQSTRGNREVLTDQLTVVQVIVLGHAGEQTNNLNLKGLSEDR
jgi:hypothetical protein